MKKILLTICTCVALLFTTTSCDKKGKDDFVDYVKQTKLTQSYEGKEFFRDGIGQVTLDQCIDGDTAHFYSNGKLLKVRFNGIDTPESTGAIEPYGKKASRFTCKLLTNAKEKNLPIVIQSEGDHAKADSTGSRYLGWVWAGEVLVNLALVQEGYTTAKGHVGTQYEDPMYLASRQAIAKKLNIWSGKPDDEFNYGDYVVTNLKEINSDSESWLGQKVEFNAIVTRRIASNAYVQQDVINDDGETETYGLYVFTAYNSYASQFLKEGNEVHFYGVIATYMGNLQLTDVKYNPVLPGEHYSEIIGTNQPYTLQTMTIPQIKATPFTNVLVKLENVTYVTSNSYVNDNGMSINVKDSAGNTLIVRVSKDVYFTDDDGQVLETKEQMTNYFSAKGKMTFVGNITYFEGDYGDGSNQLNLPSKSDFYCL